MKKNDSEFHRVIFCGVKKIVNNKEEVTKVDEIIKLNLGFLYGELDDGTPFNMESDELIAYDAVTKDCLLYSLGAFFKTNDGVYYFACFNAKSMELLSMDKSKSIMCRGPYSKEVVKNFIKELRMNVLSSID